MQVSVLSLVRTVMIGGLLFACLAGLASAAPPTFVYRGTSVAPDVAFAQGFPARGNNEDMIQHITGASCTRSQDSAFVSTSATEAVAHSFTRRHIRMDIDSDGYVYRIRADGNFFSAYDSLMEAYGRTRNPSFQETANYYQEDHEFLARGGVQPSLVESVTIYRFNERTRQIEVVETRQNPNYIAADTTANAAPYPISTPPGDRRSIAPSFSFSHVSACFACFRSEADSRRKRSLDEQLCSTFEVGVKDRPTPVIDPLTGEKVERYVPWKSWRRTNNYATYWGPVNCDIQPGGKGGDLLAVKCPASLSRSFKRFSVALGAGGKRNTWVDTRFDNGVTGTPWIVTSSGVPVVNSLYTLADYTYPISVVFGGYSKSWWSGVTVLPEYPSLAGTSAPLCVYKDANFSGRLGCLPSSGQWVKLDKLMNDQISSIETADRQRYQVCEGVNFAGKCRIFQGRVDYVELNRLGLNDRISSLRLCHKSPPAQRRASPNNRGLIGDVYVYDNPRSNKREFFQLQSSTYGRFPTNQRSNGDWRYLSGYDEC